MQSANILPFAVVAGHALMQSPETISLLTLFANISPIGDALRQLEV